VLGQRYQPGDVVQDFTLTDRATRQPLRLSDFEGKIVFLEWFAWWCPFCQAAAPQVEAGIVQHYASRGGNPAGIPVVHVAVNLQANQEAQTQNFINRAGFDLVAEDFTRALANRFQSGGQPIFAIINGVANSPGHRQWALLLHQNGYGSSASPIERFRAAIDAVQAPVLEPVVIVRQPTGQEVPIGNPVTLSVEVTGTAPLSFQWFKSGQKLVGEVAGTLRLSAVTAADSGVYRVEITNPVGTVLSDAATLAVLPPAAPARITAIARRVNGEVELAVEVTMGRRHRLEVSPDLGAWTLVREFTPETADLRLTDSSLPDAPQAYYRLISF
jgi:thiol-disulfide isomerase/thioredoxin